MGNPVLPPWAKAGCKVIETWEETIQSGTAIGHSKWVRYINAKGNEEVTMMWVRWNPDTQWAYLQDLYKK